jgi:MFS family permease
MSFVMTATPVSMHSMDGHSLTATGWVIQSHILAMYLPSLFSGSLIGRLGVRKVMSLGVLAMMATAVMTLAGRGLPNYWLALVLLGVGWNFLFVGGTILLTQSYRSAERFKAQALNDFMIFGTQALASLSAGAVLFRTGWNVLVTLTLPILIGMGAAIFWLQKREERRGIPQDLKKAIGPGLDGMNTDL